MNRKTPDPSRIPPERRALPTVMDTGEEDAEGSSPEQQLRGTPKVPRVSGTESVMENKTPSASNALVRSTPIMLDQESVGPRSESRASQSAVSLSQASPAPLVDARYALQDNKEWAELQEEEKKLQQQEQKLLGVPDPIQEDLKDAQAEEQENQLIQNLEIADAQIRVKLEQPDDVPPVPDPPAVDEDLQNADARIELQDQKFNAIREQLAQLGDANILPPRQLPDLIGRNVPPALERVFAMNIVEDIDQAEQLIGQQEDGAQRIQNLPVMQDAARRRALDRQNIVSVPRLTREIAVLYQTIAILKASASTRMELMRQEAKQDCDEEIARMTRLKEDKIRLLTSQKDTLIARNDAMVSKLKIQDEQHRTRLNALEERHRAQLQARDAKIQMMTHRHLLCEEKMRIWRQKEERNQRKLETKFQAEGNKHQRIVDVLTDRVANQTRQISLLKTRVEQTKLTDAQKKEIDKLDKKRREAQTAEEMDDCKKVKQKMGKELWGVFLRHRGEAPPQGRKALAAFVDYLLGQYEGAWTSDKYGLPAFQLLINTRWVTVSEEDKKRYDELRDRYDGTDAMVFGTTEERKRRARPHFLTTMQFLAQVINNNISNRDLEEHLKSLILNWDNLGGAASRDSQELGDVRAYYEPLRELFGMPGNRMEQKQDPSQRIYMMFIVDFLTELQKVINLSNDSAKYRLFFDYMLRFGQLYGNPRRHSQAFEILASVSDKLSGDSRSLFTTLEEWNDMLAFLMANIRDGGWARIMRITEQWDKCRLETEQLKSDLRIKQDRIKRYEELYSDRMETENPYQMNLDKCQRLSTKLQTLGFRPDQILALPDTKLDLQGGEVGLQLRLTSLQARYETLEKLAGTFEGMDDGQIAKLRSSVAQFIDFAKKNEFDPVSALAEFQKSLSVVDLKKMSDNDARGAFTRLLVNYTRLESEYKSFRRAFEEDQKNRELYSRKLREIEAVEKYVQQSIGKWKTIDEFLLFLRSDDVSEILEKPGDTLAALRTWKQIKASLIRVIRIEGIFESQVLGIMTAVQIAHDSGKTLTEILAFLRDIDGAFKRERKEERKLAEDTFERENRVALELEKIFRDVPNILINAPAMRDWYKAASLKFSSNQQVLNLIRSYNPKAGDVDLDGAVETKSTFAEIIEREKKLLRKEYETKEKYWQEIQKDQARYLEFRDNAVVLFLAYTSSVRQFFDLILLKLRVGFNHVARILGTDVLLQNSWMKQSNEYERKIVDTVNKFFSSVIERKDDEKLDLNTVLREWQLRSSEIGAVEVAGMSPVRLGRLEIQVPAIAWVDEQKEAQKLASQATDALLAWVDRYNSTFTTTLKTLGYKSGLEIALARLADDSRAIVEQARDAINKNAEEVNLVRKEYEKRVAETEEKTARMLVWTIYTVAASLHMRPGMDEKEQRQLVDGMAQDMRELRRSLRLYDQVPIDVETKYQTTLMRMRQDSLALQECLQEKKASDTLRRKYYETMLKAIEENGGYVMDVNEQNVLSAVGFVLKQFADLKKENESLLEELSKSLDASLKDRNKNLIERVRDAAKAQGKAASGAGGGGAALNAAELKRQEVQGASYMPFSGQVRGTNGTLNKLAERYPAHYRTTPREPGSLIYKDLLSFMSNFSGKAGVPLSYLMPDPAPGVAVGSAEMWLLLGQDIPAGADEPQQTEFFTGPQGLPRARLDAVRGAVGNNSVVDDIMALLQNQDDPQVAADNEKTQRKILLERIQWLGRYSSTDKFPEDCRTFEQKYEQFITPAALGALTDILQFVRSSHPMYAKVPLLVFLVDPVLRETFAKLCGLKHKMSNAQRPTHSGTEGMRKSIEQEWQGTVHYLVHCIRKDSSGHFTISVPQTNGNRMSIEYD